MATLVIETATAACSVALIDGVRLVARTHEVVERGHAERLVPMIAELLAGVGTARPMAILVDCGPGSFTGIRVGLAAARALALAWDAPVAGFGSLALIAAAAPEQDVHAAGHRHPAWDHGTIAVALAGGHGELFVQRFAGAPLTPLAPVASLTPDAAAAAVPNRVVLGSGAAALVAARGWGEARAALPDAGDVPRLPAALAGLPPSPIYGRAPDAAVSR